MPCEIEKALKEEIEFFLCSSGFLQTLRVFRKEYGSKLERCSDENFSSTKSNKQIPYRSINSLLKRYLEIRSETSKTQSQVCNARKKLDASVKKVNQLRLKLDDITEVCSKHISFNLELVDALEAKVRAIYNGESKDLSVSNAQVLGSGSIYNNIYVNSGENRSSVFNKNELYSQKPGYPNSVSSVPSCENLNRLDTFSNNSSSIDVISDIQIIPEDELHNIYPLASVSSLSSCMASKKGSTKIGISDLGTDNNIDHIIYHGTEEMKKLKALDCEQTHESNTCLYADSSCYSESSQSARSSYLGDFSKKNKTVGKIVNRSDGGLRQWCEDFLKNIDETNRSSSSSTSKLDTSCTENSFCCFSLSSHTTESEDSDSSSPEINYHAVLKSPDDRKVPFVELLHTNHSSSSIINYSSEWSLSKRENRSFGVENFYSHGEKVEVNVKEKHEFNLLRILNKKSIISSHKHDSTKNLVVGENFLPDSNLPKYGNEMVVKRDGNIILDSKTPLMKKMVEVKKYKSNISSNNQGVGSCGYLGSSYTIQSESRSLVDRKKESDVVHRCRKGVLPHSFAYSDNAKDKVRKRAEPPESNGGCDLEIFSNESEIIGQSNFFTLNSSSSLKSHEDERKLENTYCKLNEDVPGCKILNNSRISHLKEGLNCTQDLFITPRTQNGKWSNHNNFLNKNSSQLGLFSSNTKLCKKNSTINRSGFKNSSSKSKLRDESSCSTTALCSSKSHIYRRGLLSGNITNVSRNLNSKLDIISNDNNSVLKNCAELLQADSISNQSIESSILSDSKQSRKDISPGDLQSTIVSELKSRIADSSVSLVGKEQRFINIQKRKDRRLKMSRCQ